mmetsp:Transcript_1532/g.2535  ORF Transcript_1532/g.2535 Transcript_1532/m.2535 type:complete len:135 (+) Transcript_1532:104-508(+)
MAVSVARLGALGLSRHLARQSLLPAALCIPARSLKSSSISSADHDIPADQKFMHLPLGQVPKNVSPEMVREKWHSNAMEMIQQVPPIVVEGKNVVACDGGGGAEGHPIEFIKLDMPYPAVCKYCGLRYIAKKDH